MILFRNLAENFILNIEKTESIGFEFRQSPLLIWWLYAVTGRIILWCLLWIDCYLLFIWQINWKKNVFIIDHIFHKISSYFYKARNILFLSDGVIFMNNFCFSYFIVNSIEDLSIKNHTKPTEKKMIRRDSCNFPCFLEWITPKYLFSRKFMGIQCVTLWTWSCVLWKQLTFYEMCIRDDIIKTIHYRYSQNILNPSIDIHECI